MDEKQYLHERLRQLQEAYQRDAKPFVDRLVAIASMEAPSYVVTAEEWARFKENRFQQDTDK